MKEAFPSILLCWLFLLGIVFFVIACGDQVSSETQQDIAPTEEYPKTPEEVVRRYQAYVDSNRFELAQSLSTPRSAPLHEMMADIVADTPSDSSLIHTEFVRLECSVQQDTAICSCLLRDEYEEYESEYILVQVDDRWLVDLPDEEGDFELFEQEAIEEWPERE